jgi:hypothetical protein
MIRLIINKFLILIITAFLFKGTISFAHSGATGPNGCHMNYSNGNYHCHETKTPDPFATYYYIKHQGNSYGPYSSYNSCMNALNGANLRGAYCSQ